MAPVPFARSLFRFRLRTLFLIAAVAALLIAQVTSALRVRRLQAENQALNSENSALRFEAGHLTIADRNWVAVIALPVVDELTWRWKVWLPKGNWSICIASEAIPQSGFVAPALSLGFNGEKEVTVVATVRKAPNGDWQRIVLCSNGPEGRDKLPPSHAMIPGHPGPVSSTWNQAGARHHEESFDPGEPVVLLRLRVFKSIQTSSNAWSAPPITTPTDGFFVWLVKRP